MYDKIVVLRGNVPIKVNLLAKTINAILVRTEDNRYLLISRDFIENQDDFKFKD